MKIFTVLIIMFFALVSVSAQGQPLMLFWDEVATCGRANTNLDAGSISCAVTQDTVSSSLRTFHHGEISVSMTYWRFTDALRVLVVVENRGETAVPVNVKLWNLTGFKSFESFEALEKPLFMSKPERPLSVISQSEVETLARRSNPNLPTNDPLTTKTTERRVFNPETGRTTTEKNTTIVREDTPPPTSMELRGKAGDSALKWTTIETKTKKIGEVSFGTRSSAKFHLLSLDVNGVVYIYPLKPRTK
ncbi:MAG: hypothetical protein IPM25_16745 [Chloracidobacterium sp.]|nr:hypothetical protein [Chloracidobacterium sp.]